MLARVPERGYWNNEDEKTSTGCGCWQAARHRDCSASGLIRWHHACGPGLGCGRPPGPGYSGSSGRLSRPRLQRSRLRASSRPRLQRLQRASLPAPAPAVSAAGVLPAPATAAPAGVSPGPGSSGGSGRPPGPGSSGGSGRPPGPGSRGSSGRLSRPRLPRLQRASLPAQAPAAVAPAASDLRLLPASSPESVERERVLALMDYGRANGADVQAWIASGQSVAELRQAVWNAQATETEAGRPATLASVVSIDPQEHKTLRGMADGLFVRAGLTGMPGLVHAGGEAVSDGGHFRGMTARELLAACMESSTGQRVPAHLVGDELIRVGLQSAQAQSSQYGGGDLQAAMRAMSGLAGQQGRTDFSELLEYSGNRVAVAGFMGASPQVINWRQWCSTSSSSDFRAKDYKLLGAPPYLAPVNDQGELPHADLPDAEEGSITTVRRGQVYGVSYETIVNDELGGVLMEIMQAGMGGQWSIQVDAIKLLTANSGLGVTVGGNTIFHSTRSNIGTAAALDADNLLADATLMVALKAIGNDEKPLGRRPDVLLVPWNLGRTASLLNGTEFERRTALSMEALTNQQLPTSYQLFRDRRGDRVPNRDKDAI